MNIHLPGDCDSVSEHKNIILILREFEVHKLIDMANVLSTFVDMWYQMFLWIIFSSIFVHAVASTICFATLRKHKYGKFFPILIIIMGILLPITSGVLSSAIVAFVYRTLNYSMPSLYAFVWGIGHTVAAACVGFNRILATL